MTDISMNKSCRKNGSVQQNKHKKILSFFKFLSSFDATWGNQIDLIAKFLNDIINILLSLLQKDFYEKGA